MKSFCTIPRSVYALPDCLPLDTIRQRSCLQMFVSLPRRIGAMVLFPLLRSVGGDGEVFASVLNDGEIYESKQGDVRLTVPCGSLRGHGPGPIRLHYAGQMLHGEDQDFFADAIVQCPPRFRFSEPLQMDFLLDDPAISSSSGSMSGVVEKYQVFR